MKYLLLLLLLITPTITFAQTGSLQGLIAGIGGFINTVLIPFILGIAFLIFVINAIRFFVIGGSSTEGQESARSLALYGVGAFVLILSLWGMVNLLANGFGLNEGPCIDGQTIQSDYIDSNAPCSSPRPRPRPPETTPAVVAPPVVTPATTNPTGGGTSFTPDGNPLAYAPVQTATQAIRTKTRDYFSEELPIAYGANASIVERALFADLNVTPNESVSETNRLKAAYRLQLAGAIDTTDLNSYYEAVNEFQTTVNDPNVISRNTLTNIRVALPASVTTNIEANKAAITRAIISSNAENDMASPINATQVVNDIFDTSRPLTARRASFEALYDHPNNPLPGNTLRDQFIANYNTEKAFNGQFDVEF